MVTTATGTILPRALECEYARNPMGIDVPTPRLFWKLDGQARNQRQSARQILVASSSEELAHDQGTLWDSGKVLSDETVQIPYAGKPLRSSQEVFWKVRAWDQDGKVSAWSETASWTMGLLSQTDWTAKWVGTPPLKPPYETVLLRHEFMVNPGLKRAVVHVCGLGQYELALNGARPSKDLLSPGWTKYDKTCLYDTLELTDWMRPGKNAVGLFLGNGMYNVHRGRYTKFVGTFGPLKAIAQFCLEYADGTTQTFGTDEDWRVYPGPITFSSIYGGEDYDARLEPDGWNNVGFDDSLWDRATIFQGPGGQLRGFSCSAPPLREVDIIKPVHSQAISNNVVVFDLGQNAPIMVRLKVKGPAGSSVKVIPAELTNPDGSVDRSSCGHNRPAWWRYALAGKGDEKWFSKFFYHGCRYLQVERAPAPGGEILPEIQTLEGVLVHSSSVPVSEFSCSNDLFNRIHTLVRWAQRANMVSVLTDCPHRERLGWLEQYHLNGPSLRYEFDLAQLFTKGMNDMADSQLADGLVPNIAPEYTVFKGAFRDSPEWGSAFILVPWQQYQFDGDSQLLSHYYEAMKRYVEYLGTKATNNIVSHGLGDWYDLGSRSPGEAQLTPKALTATAFYFYDNWVLEQTAALLGKRADAEAFKTKTEQIRSAFNQEFFHPETRTYSTGSQCANSIPLVMGLVDETNRAAVLNAVVADVRNRGDSLTAGDVGYRYLLRALAEGGRSDVIFDMNNQSEKPGYGYQLKMGATSLTEAWNANPHSSQNHFMLGHIIEWFYADLAGIATDPSGPGFKKFILRPEPVGHLIWVKAAYDSLHGRVCSEWKRTASKFVWDIKVPANTTATIFVPALGKQTVTESGVPADKALGVRVLHSEPDRKVFQIGSGSYQFISE